MNSNKPIFYVNTECSPSYIFSNLTETKEKLFYIHNSENQPRIIVIDKKLFENKSNYEKLGDYVNKLNYSESNQYTCIKCIDNLIAIGNIGEFKILDVQSSKIIYSKSVSNNISFHGIDFMEQKSNTNNSRMKVIILLGDSMGQIYSLFYGENNDFKEEKIYKHKKDLTITCLTITTTGISACGFENGSILLFDGYSNKNFSELQLFEHEYNLPVTCISNNNKYIFAGYSNGEIRSYSLESLSLYFILQSHIKCVTSISVYKQYLVTTGEDGFVNVYEINKEEILEIKNNIELDNKVPVGVVFSNNKLYVSSMDTPILSYIDNVIE